MGDDCRQVLESVVNMDGLSICLLLLVSLLQLPVAGNHYQHQYLIFSTSHLSIVPVLCLSAGLDVAQDQKDGAVRLLQFSCLHKSSSLLVVVQIIVLHEMLWLSPMYSHLVQSLCEDKWSAFHAYCLVVLCSSGQE